MKKALAALLTVGCFGEAAPHSQQQSWTGVLSDSRCANSHQVVASPRGLTDRQCMFECIYKALARYVLVDGKGQVIPIANQDFAGFPLYLGRPVRIVGETNGSALAVSSVEPIAAHLHLGHLMTNWRDTPQSVGLLTAAISDANVAAIHAKLALAAADNLAEMKLHAGHVVHALDPGIEPRGPASGYGVKRAATGALQHLDLAVQGEGSTANIKTHATHVSASLNDVLQWTDRAVAIAQQIRSSESTSDAARLVAELVALTTAITDGRDANDDGQVDWQSGEGGLQQAQTHMALLMKGEGLQNVPR
jgi:hypothetical protein